MYVSWGAGGGTDGAGLAALALPDTGLAELDLLAAGSAF
jgi:hypothetical protein